MGNPQTVAQTEADIAILDYPDCVRLRTAMYLPNKTHAIFEIIDNAVDEYLAGRCSVIQVTIAPDEKISILDNGSGIPVEKHPDPRYAHLSKAEVAFTVLHAGGKFGSAKEGSYATATSGLHGVGASCTNATSSQLILTVFKNQTIYQAIFEKGLITQSLQEVNTYEEEFSGTQVDFYLDSEVWKDEAVDYERLKKRLKQIAYLNPGLMINYDCQLESNLYKEDFYFPDGVRSYVEELVANRTPIMEPLYYTDIVQDVSIQFALCFTEAHSADTYSFCNNVHTEAGGDHLIGMNQGIAKAINDYAQDKKILKDDQKFDTSDCLEGITAVISIIAKDAAFEGQGKSKIKMGYIRPIIRTYANDSFFSYLDHNPDQAQVILEKVLLSQKARLAAVKAREAVRKQKGAPVGNPKGLAQCLEKDPELCEIYLVEGDSAAGSAKLGRDKNIQAILPVFGKILNTEKANSDAVIDNIKLEEIEKALKCGAGEDFNLEDLRYHKVIPMTDAD